MEYSDEEHPTSDTNSKRIVVLNQKTYDCLKVTCEWNNCSKELDRADKKFYKHVSKHLEDPEIIGIGEDEEEMYKCSWSTCSFETKASEEIIRHLKYHAYHAELKALGKFVSDVQKLPPCVVPSEFHVLTNVEDSPHICEWNFCNEESVGMVEFIDHVRYHIKSITVKSCKGHFKCLWTGCSMVTPVRGKLFDHVKTHTKQHFIACPQCGHTFANKTKYADHCLTQKPLEEHVHQCDYCLTFHPSERLLKKHMAQHIHHYKCPFCDMTCNKPSILSKHMRYKHLDYKPFACSLCEYKGKSNAGLQDHLLTHDKGQYPCQEPGCDYVASTRLASKKHNEKSHIPGSPSFCCHLCNEKYKTGNLLTKHLGSVHNLKKPSGYSRFQYRLDSDGQRRLQTVRLESIEIGSLELEEDYIGTPSDEEPMVLPVDSQVPSGSTNSKTITVDVLSENGEIVSSIIAIPMTSLPPSDAKVIAVGSAEVE